MKRRHLDSVLEDSSILKLWKEARRGDPKSARLLLLSFCMFIENNQPIPRLLSGYLRSAFRHHLEDGTPIERALLLRPAHRAKGSHGRHADPLRLAALYFLYRKRDRLPITKAKDKVATESKTSRRTVDEAVKKNDDLNSFSVQELEAIATSD